ncbi:MAG: hypothetical protein ACW98I_02290 [Candidatus Hodarchaeales archaeon]
MVDPLYLPKGSVRALLTVSIAVTFLITLIQDSLLVEEYRSLSGAFIFAIAFYYSTRTADFNEDEGREKVTPLYLPRATIRIFLAIIVIAALYISYERSVIIPDYIIMILLPIAGFIAGKLLNNLFGTNEEGILGHLQAIIVLGVMGLSSFLLIIGSIPIFLTKGIIILVMSIIIAFYFGWRS